MLLQQIGDIFDVGDKAAWRQDLTLGDAGKLVVCQPLNEKV